MSGAREWWRTFFTGPWHELHARVFSSEETLADIHLLLKHLRIKPPARLLDVPCGDGRMTIELARRGYEVTGVDVSRKVVQAARQEARAAGVSVDIRCVDMRELPWRGKFEGVFNIGGSFGYFDDPGNLRAVRAIGRALSSGGRFVLEAMVAESVLPRFQERSEAQIGDIAVFQACTYDCANSRMNTVWTFVKQGHVTKRKSSTRIYTCRELTQLLEEAGFHKIRIMSWPSNKKFQVAAPLAYLSAEKP